MADRWRTSTPSHGIGDRHVVGFDRRRRIGAHVEGTVQGVGFRPYVYRLARGLGLGGFVQNESAGVHVEVEGPAPAVARFLARLPAEAPALARVEVVRTEELAPRGEQSFAIAVSDRSAPAAPVVAADAAPCAACVAELFDPADRRWRYPFINCTACGPRFTIVEDVPYDRARTTMAGFAMCARCRAEYDDPADRRFHAEPNACPACGPRLRLVDSAGAPVDADPLVGAARALDAGAIVAVKGVGGFHLACRADDAGAVARLRRNKEREEKPFALMVRDLAAARRLVHLAAEEAAVLADRVRPIVLARRRGGAAVAAGVAPASDLLGVMLPSSPLHTLLLAETAGPLVMTSGNASDEPIAWEDDDALARLGPIADLLLLHDRPIATRADDSIVRIVARRPVVLRRARGLVPGPVTLPVATPVPLLAVGGELKSVCALAHGSRAWLTQHLGDLSDERAWQAFLDTLARFERLFDVAPAAVAHDLHPGYRSTSYATALAGVARIGVQHHHAHVASCLADNGCEGPAIGVAWDGTGYGPDGHVWGGEFLVADLRGFVRYGHLEEVPLAGGDAAVREPWRMAAVMLRAAYGEAADALPLPFVRRLDRSAWRLLARAAEVGLNAPLTSSAGRLFDAVAALVGLGDRVTFEAQAAMALEATAAGEVDRTYPVRIETDLVVRTTDVVRGVVEDLLAGVDAATIAARFHATLAAVIVRVCQRIRRATGLGRVALSGGVFQNARLLDAAATTLARDGFEVLVHRQVPPNDGGLALGQAAVAARRLADGDVA